MTSVSCRVWPSWQHKCDPYGPRGTLSLTCLAIRVGVVHPVHCQPQIFDEVIFTVNSRLKYQGPQYKVDMFRLDAYQLVHCSDGGKVRYRPVAVGQRLYAVLCDSDTLVSAVCLSGCDVWSLSSMYNLCLRDVTCSGTEMPHCIPYTSVSQTVVRGPQVVLGFCPCGPFRLNISPKKTEKIKLTWIAYHTL